MSSIDDNIRNAFKILLKTYENVQKLMESVKNIAKSGDVDYVLLTDKFLRWRSDTYYEGWACGSVMLLFKRRDNEQNVIYGMWIDFRYSIFVTAKLVYKSAVNYNATIGPADIWKYDHSLANYQNKFLLTEENGYTRSVPRSDDVSKKYLGLDYALFTEIPLSEVKADTLKEQIFDAFDKLAAL